MGDSESFIYQGLQDVSEEIETFGKTISTSVSLFVEKITEAGAQNVIYQDRIHDLIKNEISHLIKRISTIKIDLSPIMQIAADISNNNKEILSVLNTPKEDSGEAKYRELLAVLKSNDERFIELLSVLKLLTDKKPITEKRPLSFEMHHTRDNGQLISSTIIPKYQ